MNNTRIYKMSFASVYPLYVAKAEKKGRIKSEVDKIILWLTGYNQQTLNTILKKETDFETFFKKAPKPNPARALIKGVVCGVRVEDIKEPTMREIRYLDKLIDELAKGKALEKILRKIIINKTNNRMTQDIKQYNSKLKGEDKKICNILVKEIYANLTEAESKVWHGHPVWFLDGNPIVGYGKLKASVQLLFWSGQTFKEKGLKPEGSFKAAEVRYTKAEEVNVTHLTKWLKKAKKIQWDYKNIVKRKGKLILVK